MTRIYIPRDSGALAVGADEVAAAFAAVVAEGSGVEIVRNGSRGLYWLEPLVEVETPAGRFAYGPVTPQDAASVLAAALAGGPHPLALGPVADIPWLKRQTRLTFARCGVTDPLSIADYRSHGGFAGLERALALGPEAIVEEVVQSGLRGRGGAGFPTGIKWRTVAQTVAPQKYIVCNADEGDSGTFADRMIMEGDPFVLIEGMVIAGIAVGATKGYVYIRSEYPHAIAAMNAAVSVGPARAAARSARRRLVPCLRHRNPRRRRRLCLRRGDLAARKPRRRARARSGKAAVARAYRPVRPADRHQQRALARLGADRAGARRGALPRFRHGPFARHHADPARRQYPPWRALSKPRSASRSASSSTTSAAAPRAGGRCARSRSAGRSGPISRARCSTRRSTTRRSRRATG